MRRETADIRTDAEAWTVVASYLAREPGRLNDHVAKIASAGAIAALIEAGFEIMRKAAPVAEQDAPAEGFPTSPVMPEAGQDTWGLYQPAADDFARAYGCRVDVAGLDDATCPLTADDFHHIAAVTEQATGRLVGLVDCWHCEDGDPLVPGTWLSVVLGAWQAERAPRRSVA